MNPKLCTLCDETFSLARYELGFRVCLTCGEKIAAKRKHTIVPMNKSNYVVISDPNILKQLNPKRSSEL